MECARHEFVLKASVSGAWSWPRICESGSLLVDNTTIAKGRNGEFCVTVGPISRTVG